MKALLLAAGRGSRLGAAAGGLPKPLTRVGTTTPLEHAVAWVSAAGVERIWINVHQHARIIRERIGTHAGGVPVSYSFEPELLGTAGAWKKLEEQWTGTSLVIYGDNLMHFDLAALLATHRRGGAIATVALFDPARHANTGPGGGRAALEASRITKFEEGGADGLINAGAYCIEPELRMRLTPGFSDFGHDVLPALAESGDLAGHLLEDGAYCLGVDTPERLRTARAMLLNRIEAAR